MAQGAQLIEIYGWVDDLLLLDEADHERAAFWVPPYAGELEPGWYDAFRAAFGIPNARPLDGIDKSLRLLRRLDPNGMHPSGPDGVERRMDGRSVARRLYALNYLAQVLPKVYGVDGTRAELIVPLLQQLVRYDRDGLSPRDVVAFASKLHAELTKPLEGRDQDGPQRAFEQLVVQSVDDGSLAPSFQENTDVVCDDTHILQKSIDGTLIEAALLTTDFCIQGRSVSDFEDLLNPARWPICFGQFWCAMERLSPPEGAPPPVGGVHDLGEFRETVGQCDDPSGWTLSTCLSFKRKTLADGSRVLSFRLCPKDHQDPDNVVLVDSGFIKITPTTDGVCITTAKAIAIDGVPEEGLQIAACVSEWGQGAKDVAFACSQAPLEETLVTYAERPPRDQLPGRIVVPASGGRRILRILGSR